MVQILKFEHSNIVEWFKLDFSPPISCLIYIEVMSSESVVSGLKVSYKAHVINVRPLAEKHLFLF